MSGTEKSRSGGLVLSPSPSQWAAALRRPLDGQPGAPRASVPSCLRAFRAQLGLPESVPLIMSGHQAQVWHAGILAKYLALRAAAEANGAEAAWVVVSQDDNDPTAIEYPVRTAEGGLARAVWQLGDAPPVAASHGRWRPGGQRTDRSEQRSVARGGPVCLRPAITPGPVPEPADGARFACDHVRGGLERIRAALEEARGHGGAGARGAGSLAGQFSTAAFRLAGEVCDGAGWGPLAVRVIQATDLARTDLFAELVRRMATDPDGCVRAYNEAVARHPGAGVRPLEGQPRGADSGSGQPMGPEGDAAPTAQSSGRWHGIELPLWELADGQRRAVYAADLEGMPVDRLAPRALLMTGMLRLAGCDLFVHGTGGAGDAEGGVESKDGYDRVTEDWLGLWLGERLAPAAMATATVAMACLAGDVPTEAEVAGARQQAHKARHEPSLIGDAAAAGAKRSLLEQIESTKARGRDPSPLFRRMHGLLEEHRRRNAAALEGLDRRVRELEAAESNAGVARERGWAFPLLEPEAIVDLAARVERVFRAD